MACLSPLAPLALLASALVACASTSDDAQAGAADLTAGASNIPLFAETTILQARLEAPLQDLFDQIPKPVADENAPGGFDVPDVSKLKVTGTFIYDDAHGHKELPVTVTLRGNTSLFELAFPKLSLKFDDAVAKGTLVEHAKKIKIGTHGGESDKLTPLGRRANQDAPHREAFVYAMLDTLGVPTFKARPAVITYRDTGTHHVAGAAADGTLVRKAFFLEDNDDVAQRLGGKDLGDGVDMDSVSGKWSTADVTRVELAEALVGNPDWEIDRSVFNVKAMSVDHDRKVVFTPYDFDLATVVTANDADAMPAKFFPGKSPAFHDVASILNRIREGGYKKAEVDAAVAAFATKRDALRTLIAGAALPAADRTRMQDHVDAFFDATQPASFYLPHTTGPVPVYSDAALTKQIGRTDAANDDGFDAMYNCGSPLSILEKSADGKAVHVSFLYEDFKAAPDGWLEADSVIGGDGKTPDEVNRCFVPGTD